MASTPRAAGSKSSGPRSPRGRSGWANSRATSSLEPAHRDHGRDLERAVQVREGLLASLQVLPAHLVAPAGEPLAPHARPLVGGRAVDEALGGQRVGRVDAGAAGGPPAELGGDVEDHTAPAARSSSSRSSPTPTSARISAV